MSHLSVGMPSFSRMQSVRFVGGEGLLCSHTAAVGKGMYLIEMILGAAPIDGRVGAETMVWLYEADW